jgi:predicted O-methyltransferase YrrM
MPPFCLNERLYTAVRSDRFLRAARGAPDRPQQITNHATQAVLGELVRLIPSARVLEIGTYFADTSRYLAEIMVDTGGQLTTIDPFGGARVPGIIARWPGALQQRVTFRPDNSMAFFLKLEERQTQIGAGAPFDIIFVDGHHTFEYAFFDLMRSALYLRPGGAIVVDNVSQAGPAEALRLFLSDHQHWSLFKIDANSPGFGFMPQVESSILLAPEGLELTPTPCKFQFFDIRRTQIDSIRLNVLRGHGGRIIATTNLYVMPLDLHITGIGAQSSVATIDHALQPSQMEGAVLRYHPPLKVAPLSPDHPVNVEIEISHVHDEDTVHLLLDADSPIAFGT